MDQQVKAQCEDGTEPFTDAELISIAQYETASSDNIAALSQSTVGMAPETIQALYAAARDWGTALNDLVRALNPSSNDPISEAGQRFIRLQSQSNATLFQQFTADLIASRAETV